MQTVFTTISFAHLGLLYMLRLLLSSLQPEESQESGLGLHFSVFDRYLGSSAEPGCSLQVSVPVMLPQACVGEAAMLSVVALCTAGT
jgi:hypothetical protein